MKNLWLKPLNWLIRRREVRTSKILTFILFRFFPKTKNRKTLWDSTSVLLRSALHKWIQNNSTVLEIGTGDIGLLSNYLIRIKTADITAVDICNDFILNCHRNCHKNKIHFLTSNLFESITELKYDYIFSNPPYVKSSMIDKDRNLKYHGFSHESMVAYASDGGEDGLQIINKILTEGKYHLKPNGSLIIGYNESHVDKNNLLKTIHDNNYYIFDRITGKFTSCICLNLKIRKNEQPIM